MRVPVNFSFDIPIGLLRILRDMAQLVNRVSDAFTFIRQVSTGSQNGIARFLTSSSTLDFPSVTSNGMETLTITVTGAVVGDFVIVSPPAAFEAGFTFVGFVSSADTVTIRIHNNNIGSVDPASATWGALVIGVG